MIFSYCLFKPEARIFHDETPIKACIISLLQNKDLLNLAKLVQQFELAFNKNYHYPYVFYNNEEFTNEFKQEIRKHTNSTIEFVLVKKEHWNVPEWIDKIKLNKSLQSIGHSVNYRQMCRFNSGFFFRDKVVLKYDYFMRLDSDSSFQCEFESNPFLRFKYENYKYGFILSYHEGAFTIPTLWSTIKSWSKSVNLNLSNEHNKQGISFISDDKGESLNGQFCMFYNNFEIGAFSVFRDKSYLDFFDYLDKSGGFFYERWVNYILKY